MGLTGLGKIISQTIRQIGRFLRYIGNRIVCYFKKLLHYLYEYARLAYRYLARIYNKFQDDPLTFLQFTGSLAIMIYYGVL